MDYLILVAGLIFLVKGADFFVKGSSALSRRLGISSLVIGLTVVSFGTSAPEFMVSVLASIKGTNEVAVGNVIGSNIANIALIIGVAATIRALKVKSSNLTHEIPFSFLAIGILFLLSQDRMFSNGGTENILSRSDGIVMLTFLLIFLYYIASLIKRHREEKKVKKEFEREYGEHDPHRLSGWKVFVYLLLGIIGLGLGGQFTVEGAVAVALSLGISQSLVAITIVAVGTSLPELATSAIAAWKNESDIAIGNVIGSNIFNIFFVLGTAATISPLSFVTKLNPDLFVMMGLTVLLFVFALHKRQISRAEGISLLVLYALYIGSLVWRG